MPSPTDTTRTQSPESVTGVQLAQGIGHRPTKGFWGEAWDQVVRRPGAAFGLSWIGVVAFFAVFAPLLASGHPLIERELGSDGLPGRVSSPLLENLNATDILLVLGAVAAVALLVLPIRLARSARLGAILVAGLQGGLAVVGIAIARSVVTGRDVSDAVRQIEQSAWFAPTACWTIAAITGVVGLLCMPFERWQPRLGAAAAVAAVVAAVCSMTWTSPIERYDYRQREALGQTRAVYTVVPHSPQQGDTTLNLKPPGSNLLRPAIDRFERSTLVRERVREAVAADTTGELAALPVRDRLARVPADAELAEVAATEIRAQSQLLGTPASGLAEELATGVESGSIATAADVVEWMDAAPVERFHLGTDSLGQDVLSQMLHACRLSISIGLISTLIAVTIGVTIGALMGYFGGWVDLLLYRIVEVFMSIPVLFLLIVAAAVLPRNTYVMMVIIGCVTWTGAARFVRAEFYKLRNQDFVQSARAVGLPLRSILFKHMLPNGVTPVLVESSFAVAAAILAEATLSFLGLGPANQASWGRLLSDATNQVGAFVWWLAIFPGLAIFLTVLAYNLIGEALRDAIDPKLKKARV